MKTLKEVFYNIDIADNFRVERYGIEVKNKSYDKRKQCNGISEEYGKELVYKVIKINDNIEYEGYVRIILSSDRVKDTKKTIYEVINID